MAARLRTRQVEDCRNKIEATLLIKRLQNHVVGKVEMSPTQVRAADILLKKRLPDLQATDLTTDGHPLDLTWVVKFVKPNSSA